MTKIAWILAGLAGLILAGEKALAWTQEGHAVVAAIAEKLLSPSTEEEVQKLLAAGGDKDLVSVASWADQVIIASHDEGPLRGNQEAMEFNQKYPKSWMWHFVNLPLGATSYEQVRSFLTPGDIIQAISHCIQVLESPTPDPQMFTRVQALRLLVHFVGDIHQPLHCGTGFYSLTDKSVPDLITDPAEAIDKPSDRGADGVEVRHFLKAIRLRTLVPHDSRFIQRPVLAYIGRIDQHLNLRLIEKLAAETLNWNILMVGPVQGSRLRLFRVRRTFFGWDRDPMSVCRTIFGE